MAANKRKLSLGIGGGSDVMRFWTYTTTDLKSEIISGGYWSALYGAELKDGDVIFYTASVDIPDGMEMGVSVVYNNE